MELTQKETETLTKARRRIKALFRYLGQRQRILLTDHTIPLVLKEARAAWDRWLSWHQDHWDGGTHIYFLRRTRCGRCRDCKADPHALPHGPYWYARHKQTKRTKYLGRKYFRLPEDSKTYRKPTMERCLFCGAPLDQSTANG